MYQMSRINRSRGSSVSFSVSNCGRKNTVVRLEKRKREQKEDTSEFYIVIYSLEWGEGGGHYKDEGEIISASLAASMNK